MKTMLVLLIAMAGFFGSVAWAQGSTAHAAVAAPLASSQVSERAHPSVRHGAAAAKSHSARPHPRRRVDPAPAGQPLTMPEFDSGKATDRPSVMCACVTLNGRA